MKHIFLTGGSGFLGSHLLSTLKGKGYLIFVATRSDISRIPAQLLDHGINWVPINEAANVIKSVKPYALLHLATEYGSKAGLHDTLLANEAWPLSLLEAAISSGTTLFINTDTFFAKPVFAYPYMQSYTLSKSNFLAWGRLASAKTSTRFVTLRLEHVFGENDHPNKFVPSLLRQLKAGDDIDLTVGTQRRDFIYAGDVANAFMTILEKHLSLNPEIDEIEIGTGRSITLRSFVETAKILSGSSSSLKFGCLPMRQNEIMNSFADTSTLKLLGWTPQFSLEDGLRRCISTSASPVR